MFSRRKEEAEEDALTDRLDVWATPMRHVCPRGAEPDTKYNQRDRPLAKGVWTILLAKGLATVLYVRGSYTLPSLKTLSETTL